jgi:heat-inducible transcriptional repressor
MADLRRQMPVGGGTASLLSNASDMLSAMSRFVGVVTVPKRAQFAFRMIDFVPLDGHRVLVILVFTDNEVQNRIIATRRPYAAGELEQAANYLNTHFSGRPLSDIRAGLLRDLRETRSEMEQVLSAAMDLAEQTLVVGSDDMLLTGQTRLMGSQGISDVDRLRELFEAFSRKREILGLLERCTQAPGVRVFIGEESGLAPLDACTVITAPYASDGRVLGVLGVIGPTRMAYDRVIPIVQATADLLGEALKTEFTSPYRGQAPWDGAADAGPAGRTSRRSLQEDASRCTARTRRRAPTTGPAERRSTKSRPCWAKWTSCAPRSLGSRTRRCANAPNSTTSASGSRATWTRRASSPTSACSRNCCRCSTASTRASRPAAAPAMRPHCAPAWSSPGSNC